MQDAGYCVGRWRLVLGLLSACLREPGAGDAESGNPCGRGGFRRVPLVNDHRVKAGAAAIVLIREIGITVLEHASSRLQGRDDSSEGVRMSRNRAALRGELL